MAEVPTGFPSKLTDEQLSESIEIWIAEYRETYPKSTLPELILAFVNTASQEQLRRQAAAAARSAESASKRALYLGLVALVVSALRLSSRSRAS